MISLSRSFRWLPLVAAALLPLFSSGCFDGEKEAEANATPGSTVAVLDLDSVADQLGRNKTMEATLQTRQETINQELVKLQEELRKEITGKQEAIGDNPSPEQQRELQTLQQRAGEMVSKAFEEAKNKLATERARLVEAFRTEVKPHAQAAANAVGAQIIVTKNTNFLFHHAGETEITADVINRMSPSAPVTPTLTEEGSMLPDSIPALKIETDLITPSPTP